MYEIERRFLIKDYPIDQTKDIVALKIQQTYLDDTGEWSIRARHTTQERTDGELLNKTTLTMKRKIGHGTRIELEEIVDHRLYNDILSLTGAHLQKTRIPIPYGTHTIELDIFHNPELQGLMIAEIELESINDQIIIPEWFGREITGEDEYSNHQLFRRLARS